MSRAAVVLGSGLLLAGTAAATTWLAMCSWRGFTTTPGRFLEPLLLLGAVVAGVGALARWWRLPAPAVRGGCSCSPRAWWPAPCWSGPRCRSEPPGDGCSTPSAAPAPPRRRTPRRCRRAPPGCTRSSSPAGSACLLLVDVLACTLRRVPLAGLPLLTVYSVPVSLLGGALSWWIFALTAAGFLTMLFLHEGEQVARWGRNLGEDPGAGAPVVGTGTTRATAGRVGGIATALAVILPLGIPTVELRLFDLGHGAGGGSDISVSNPMTDLKRDLVQGRGRAAAAGAHRRPAPAYLRIASLTRFATNEWSAGDRDVPTSNLPTGQMPPLQGVAESVPRATTTTTSTLSDSFASTWLPTQAPISRITAPGDWRYDPSTMDFLAGNDGLDAPGRAVLDDRGQARARRRPTWPRRRPVGRWWAREFTQLPGRASPRWCATSPTTSPGRRRPASRRRWPCRTGSAGDGGFTYDTDVSPGQRHRRPGRASSPRATAAAPATASSSPPRWR